MLDVVVANIEHYLAGAPANIVSARPQLFAIGNYALFLRLAIGCNLSWPIIPPYTRRQETLECQNEEAF
jgi:hypothetical protein